MKIIVPFIFFIAFFQLVSLSGLAQDDPMKTKERQSQPPTPNDSTVRPNWDVYKSTTSKTKRNRPNQSFKLGAGVQLGFPQGQFEEVSPNLRPWGLAFNALARLGKTPIWLGGDLAFVGYGRQVEVISAWGGGRIIRKNRMVIGNVVARIQPNINFPIRPYVEGMVGAKYFRTATEVEAANSWRNNNNNNNNNNSFTAPNHQDIALSYGGAGGLNIMFGNNFGLDLKVIYLLGGTATYVKPEDISVGLDPAQTIINKTTRSSTDLIAGQIGIVISF